MAIQRTHSLFGTVYNAIQAQSRALTIVFSFAVLFGVSFFAYRLWSIRREQAAQYDFSALMTEYEAVSQDANPEWDVLLSKFEKNYEKHARSSQLPYYLGYKVRILLHQNKKDEALALLDSIIADIPGSPILSLYQMEKALIQLDSSDETLKISGLDTLKNLASDQQNAYRDSAQFYLGRYYWAMDEVDAARTVWQQLVDEQHDEKLAPSPWVHYVQDKLNITVV